MWILMIKTYLTWAEGHKVELPPDIVKDIPKDCYKRTCAPWDEQVDHKAIKLTAAENKAKDLSARTEQLQRKVYDAKEAADKLVSVASDKQAEAKAAETTVKKAEKSERAKLARIANRKDCEFQKAHALLRVAIAEAALLQFDADDARCEAETAAKAFEGLKTRACKEEGQSTSPSRCEGCRN